MNEMRDRVLRHVNRDELPYRTRGEHHTRLEAFSDAVFAFAITLGVMSLEVPRDSHDLVLLARGIPTFVAVFTTLFFTWWAHSRFFRRYGLDDNHTTLLTGVLLFLVVFYTFPLKFVFSSELDGLFGAPTPILHHEDSGVLLLLFGLGMGGLALVFHLLYRHAWNLRELLDLDEAERCEARLQMSFHAWSAAVGGTFALISGLFAIPRHTPWLKPLLIGSLFALAFMLVMFLLALTRQAKERKRFLVAWRARAATVAGAQADAAAERP